MHKFEALIQDQNHQNKHKVIANIMEKTAAKLKFETGREHDKGNGFIKINSSFDNQGSRFSRIPKFNFFNFRIVKRLYDLD